MKKRKVFKKLEIWKDDDLEGQEGQGAFAAWCAGSSGEKPLIVLNLGATLSACIENNLEPKEIIIEHLMHEFGHFLEEMFDKEFDEEFIERVIQSYREKYG